MAHPEGDLPLFRRDNATRYIAPAEKALQDINTTIEKASASGRKDSKLKDFAGKVMSASRMLIPVLEGIASAHPASQAVFSAFKKFLELQADKKEVDERIALVHHSMSLSLFSLRVLVDNNDEKLDKALEQSQVLNELNTVITEFGNYTSTYVISHYFGRQLDVS